MIVGLGYEARVGKDTLADHLVRNHGFQKTAFARKLKQAAAIIFGLTHDQLYGDKKEEMDPFWEDTPRNILQKLGTECLRQGYREDVWVEALVRNIKKYEEIRTKSGMGRHFVVSDVRFPNEADALKAMGGFVINVQRPNRDKIATEQHVSERVMDQYEGWDYIIFNDTDNLEDLYRRTDHMMTDLRRRT